MAIIGGLTVPDELIQLFRKLVQVSDVNRFGSVASKGHFLSAEKKLSVSTRSLLPQISALWAALSPAEKLQWKAAANESNYNQWNLFVQDTAYRLKYGLPGLATPSLLHQYKVGKLSIAAPAYGATLAQYHPNRYYKMKKVRGTKGLYEEVAIDELFVLPLTIGLSYKSELTSLSENSYARFYTKIQSSYQGRTLESVEGFDLDFNTDWRRDQIAVVDVIGKARSYSLWLEFSDIRGDFFWDNVESRHSGVNYARDFRCNDVNNELSRINFQIEKSWEEEFLPTGSSFDSVYFN